MTLAPSVSLVAQLAPNLSIWQVRSDRNQINVERMRNVLRAKFDGNPDLAGRLVDTDDAELIEASPRDPFWGSVNVARVKNVLGRPLMELRAELSHRCKAAG